jgi:hypothetical protein
VALLTSTRDLTADEMRHGIVSDLERLLPDVDASVLEREVVIELDSFGDPPVRQYLPVLIARRVREHHRQPATAPV